MAEITLTLKTTVRWWVTPLLKLSVAWYWLAGRDEIAPGFIDWLVRHGVKIEVG